MGKTNKLIYFVIVLMALVVGFFIQKGFDKLHTTSEMKEVASKYPDLDISPCQVVPEGIDRKTASSNCLNGILLGYALEHRDVSPCQDIDESLIKKDCTARVARLKNLTAEEDRFCQGVTLDALCNDLAITLLASETGDSTHCAQIQNELQKSNCLALVGPAGVSEPGLIEPPELELGENGLPVPQFGLICPKGDGLCEKAQSKFLEAVASLDISLCKETGTYLELCLNELALYQSYKENDASYCEERLPKEACAIDLVIAKALDAQDPTICEQIEGEGVVDGCKNLVETAKVKRFDYLGL